MPLISDLAASLMAEIVQLEIITMRKFSHLMSFVVLIINDTLALPQSPSSSGLGRRPFTALTRVQIPLGTQKD